MKNLQDLFLDSLADMNYAEQQLVKALPKMAKAATHDDLREAFESHLTETEGHVRKVEEIFSQFGEKAWSKKCAAIVGIIKEAEEIISENKKSPTINAALVYAGQKAEHYEITSYGTLCSWSEELGRNSITTLLKQNLTEEKAADQKLTRLAEQSRNPEAKRRDTDKKSEGAAKISKVVSHGT